MNDKLLKTHFFNLSPNENSGEGLTLKTKFIANGDPITETDGVYINQELTLQSYCNCATFTLIGATLTPTLLRQLANELESARNSLEKKRSRKPKK